MNITQRKQEIDLYFTNSDIGRASQRILDLTYDYQELTSSRPIAIELRKQYNIGKQLGKTGNENESLLDALNELWSAIKPTDIPHTIHPKNKRVAEISAISKRFTSRLHQFTFEPIDISLTTGNIIGLVGENGNGKTTLLRMLCGDLSTDEGEITYQIDGHPCTNWRIIKQHVAFIPQRLDRWFGTAQDKISFEAAIKGYTGEENMKRVEFILHRMGLTNFRELSWTELSSGYRLRFEIAMALVWDPSILILDEPLANLDLQAKELLLQDLRNLANSRRNPVSVLLSSQQLHEVETVADQIIFLKNGRAIFNGSLDTFGKDSSVQTVETSGSFDYAALQELLKDWLDVTIEQSASAFLVSFSEPNTKEQLLQLMLDQKFEINYYRNITGSTKKLFSDKY